MFRLEATYEIQEDIADVVGRMGAYLDEEDRTCFKGWARMAISLSAFRITEVCTFSLYNALVVLVHLEWKILKLMMCMLNKASSLLTESV